MTLCCPPLRADQVADRAQQNTRSAVVILAVWPRLNQRIEVKGIVPGNASVMLYPGHI